MGVFFTHTLIEYHYIFYVVGAFVTHTVKKKKVNVSYVNTIGISPLCPRPDVIKARCVHDPM